MFKYYTVPKRKKKILTVPTKKKLSFYFDDNIVQGNSDYFCDIHFVILWHSLICDIQIFFFFFQRNRLIFFYRQTWHRENFSVSDSSCMSFMSFMLHVVEKPSSFRYVSNNIVIFIKYVSLYYIAFILSSRNIFILNIKHQTHKQLHSFSMYNSPVVLISHGYAAARL